MRMCSRVCRCSSLAYRKRDELRQGKARRRRGQRGHRSFFSSNECFYFPGQVSFFVEAKEANKTYFCSQRLLPLLLLLLLSVRLGSLVSLPRDKYSPSPRLPRQKEEKTRCRSTPLLRIRCIPLPRRLLPPPFSPPRGSASARYCSAQSTQSAAATWPGRR